MMDYGVNQMQYYIYENWTADHKARIHLASCRWCNYGIGIYPQASERNGQWHGPFTSLDSATGAASQTGRTVSLCRHCEPS